MVKIICGDNTRDISKENAQKMRAYFDMMDAADNLEIFIMPLELSATEFNMFLDLLETETPVLPAAISNLLVMMHTCDCVDYKELADIISNKIILDFITKIDPVSDLSEEDQAKVDHHNLCT